MKKIPVFVFKIDREKEMVTKKTGNETLSGVTQKTVTPKKTSVSSKSIKKIRLCTKLKRTEVTRTMYRQKNCKVVTTTTNKNQYATEKKDTRHPQKSDEDAVAFAKTC